MTAPANRQSRVSGILELAQGVAGRLKYTYSRTEKKVGPEYIVAEAKALRENFAGAFIADTGEMMRVNEEGRLGYKAVEVTEELAEAYQSKAMWYWLVGASIVGASIFVFDIPRWIAWNVFQQQEIPPAGVKMMLGIVGIFCCVGAINSVRRQGLAARILHNTPALAEPSLRGTMTVMESDEWKRLASIGAILNRSPIDIAEMEADSLEHSIRRALTDRALAVLEAERDGRKDEAKSLRNDGFREAFEFARRYELTKEKDFEYFFKDAAEELRRGVQSAYGQAMKAMGKTAVDYDSMSL